MYSLSRICKGLSTSSLSLFLFLKSQALCTVFYNLVNLILLVLLLYRECKCGEREVLQHQSRVQIGKIYVWRI